MSTLLGHPDRVTRKSDDSYFWYCRIDPAYYRSQMLTGFWACVGIAVFLVVMGAVFCAMNRDWSMLWVVLLCDAVFMAITVLVTRLFLRGADDPREIYELTDSYVKTGSGKTSAYYEFRRVKTLTVTRGYLELRGKLTPMRVYVPEDDMAFVRDWIRRRLPPETEISFQ